MSSIENLTLSSDAKIHDEEVNSFNMSLLIGLLIITITVLVIVSIIMNVWMKSKRSKVMVSKILRKKKKFRFWATLFLTFFDYLAIY
jgi:hypothetical protein